ncbi:MAG TPA: XRE family transcriptional regulator [Deltaproteobacteria bacterium]|nr:XRE family transcriptional regulator [Deltaproteobacteria bacterium]
MIVTMARISKRLTPQANDSGETLGQRITRLRKERGYTQAELAGMMDTIQRLISDYERDKLRPHPEMIARFAQALKVTTDEILGLKPITGSGDIPNPRILRRMKKIEELPSAKQKALLKTIDMILNAAEK